ncbi:MAG TPA: tyrosine-protein phosphatase [Candidatus Eisenbacteria bacterium]|nr:tyrosine-protein phosphatase [Candidatus Eisenbacteria bacterium]
MKLRHSTVRGGRRDRRRISAGALAFFLALAAGGASGALTSIRADARVLDQIATASGRPFAIARPEVSGIENFAEIEPGLARGAEPTDAGLQELKARGFRTVIGLRHDPDEAEKLARLGINYIEIPMHAGIFGAAVPTSAQIEQFLDVVSDPAQRPVFFHCKRGRDRTGAMAAIYRMEKSGWRKTEALEEMRAFGFHSYYRKLRRFVEGYPGSRSPADANAGAGAPTARAASRASD